jgi:hypothetical protein
VAVSVEVRSSFLAVETRRDGVVVNPERLGCQRSHSLIGRLDPESKAPGLERSQAGMKIGIFDLCFASLAFSTVDLSGRSDSLPQTQRCPDVRARGLLQAEDPLPSVLASFQSANRDVVGVKFEKVELATEAPAVAIGAKNCDRLIEALAPGNGSCFTPAVLVGKKCV